MPDAVTHPTPQELAAFSLGNLAEAAATAIAHHLEACPHCRRALTTLPPDSSLGKILPAKAGATALPQAAPRARAMALPTQRAAQPAEPSTLPPDLPPELAAHPRYRILRELGRGGMGVVYQARQTMMDRQVVIKVINKALLDHPEALERFRREVKAAAKLAHPNIVAAYDAEQAGDVHMLVMEFVPGQSLTELLQKKGPLPVAQACNFIGQAALGLQHAFEAGMVHRDVKPQNLMVTPKGLVKVLDFGLAQMRSERTAAAGLTRDNSFMGTPDYVAPEQATDARQADTRADIYSLGCTLYCLLTGRPPFQEDTTIKLVLAHLDKTAQPVHELRPDVPAELSAVVARMLAKDPAQRYQKPVEVAQALLPFARSGGKPGAAGGVVLSPGVASPGKGTMIGSDTRQSTALGKDTPKSPAQKATAAAGKDSPFGDLASVPASAPAKGKKMREAAKPAPAAWWKRPIVWAGGGAAVLTLGAGVSLLAALVFNVKTAEPIRVQPEPERVAEVKPPEPPGPEPTVVSPPEPAPQKEPSATTPSPSPQEPGPEHERVVKNIVPPDKVPPATTPATADSVEIVHELRQFTGHEGKVVRVAFAPDGKHLLSGSNSYSNRGTPNLPDHQPGDDNTVRLWEVETGRQVTVLRGHKWTVLGVAFSPKDSQLAAACSSFVGAAPWAAPTVTVYNLKTVETSYRFELPGPAPMRGIAISADGKRLVVCRGNHTLDTWNLTVSAKLPALTLEGNGGDNDLWCAAFTADLRRMAGGGGPGPVRVWDTDRGKIVQQYPGYTGNVTAVAFSPDEKRLAAASVDGTIRVWNVESANQLLCLKGHVGVVRSVAFSPDGCRILSGGLDKTLRLWDAITGEELRRFEGHTEIVWQVAISPDGRLAASASDDRTIRLWPLPEPRSMPAAVESTTPSPPDEVADASATGLKKEEDAYETAMKKARGKLLAAFDRELEALPKAKLSPEDRLKMIDAVKEEKVVLEKKGRIPWSAPMRAATLEYLKAMTVNRLRLTLYFDRAIDFYLKKKDEEKAKNYSTEKRQVLKPQILAAWNYSWGVNRSARLEFLSDGTVNGGPTVWFLDKDHVVVRSVAPPNVRGGYWFDTLRGSLDGKILAGANQVGNRITAVLLDD